MLVHSLSTPRQAMVYVGIGLLLVALSVVMVAVLPPGVDWRDTYRPATLAVLRLQSPYAADVAPGAPFVAAPWSLALLIPLAVLPVEVGRGLLLLISLAAFTFTTRMLGASPLAAAAFLLSPPVVHGLLNGNIEWIPLLGFVFPPQLGLFLVAVKPQTGFAIAVFWLFEAWRKGGLREVLRVFLPFTAALLASFLVFGLWPFQTSSVLSIARDFNASLWPASIPVGLALLVASLKRRESKFAMAASPCLSPYVLFHSWSSAVVSLSASTAEMLAAVGGLWILVLLRAFS